MSGYILCQTKTADSPYFIENISTNIYTLEELCYYLFHNLYLIDDTVMNERLCLWLQDELNLPGLAARLRANLGKDVYKRQYILHKIKWNLAYTELLSARLAYEAAEGKNLQKLLHLEEILEASRIPMEQREAARKMGSRFAKTIEKLGLNINKNGIFRKYLDARKGKAVNHSCIYGVFCAEMEIALNEAMTHYLYAQTSAIVTNCVKTIPLSQTSGQMCIRDRV